MNVERVCALCQRLQINPTELLILQLFFTGDQANLYRVAYEIPWFAGSDKKYINKQVLTKLEDKGFLKPVESYNPLTDPLVDAYEVDTTELDEIIMDSQSAAEELFYGYPSKMQLSDGRTIITRNVGLEDLHNMYVKIIGYDSRVASRTYVTSKGKQFELRNMPEINLYMIDLNAHKKVMKCLKHYLGMVKTGEMHPMGIEKFLQARMWDDEFNPMNEKSGSTVDSSGNVNFTEGFE